jgi:hypothetical protein
MVGSLCQVTCYATQGQHNVTQRIIDQLLSALDRCDVMPGLGLLCGLLI